MKKIHKSSAALNLPSLTLEGGLFMPDQLEKAALGQAGRQDESDYHTPKGLKLKDDYSRAFQIACAQWKHFAAALEREDVDALATTQTFVRELLRDACGYSNLQASALLTVNERAYPVTFLASHVPVVVAPFTAGLDDSLEVFAIAGSGSRKKSAFQLAQELVNASDAHLWAIATNGRQLRLLRDAASLTRPSFLEVDVQDVLQAQRFSEFANIWRLLHASRAGLDGQPEHCIWEAWRETGRAEGTRVRDGLRSGVEQALLTLGEGFIQHPANDVLRGQLNRGELSRDAYFQQLLRLVYRLIFLFSVEERGVLHPHDTSKAAQQARRAYAEGYAAARLRDACLKRRHLNRFDDQWQPLRIVFNGLAEGEPRLALPALGGLFSPAQCPALDGATLDNRHLLTAMRHLRWAPIGGGTGQSSKRGTLAPVDYRNMGPEELGSVYESLLELVPEVELTARTFGFIGITSEGSTAGNARKTTGSYYTPDSLVQELIKSALEPVIAQRLADNKANPTEALLAIRVIDPACGSGHFLLAAARRLAQELAQLRAEDGAVKPEDYRQALREVIGRCIFGVDRNPMALELARTALWLEGFAEGQPLSFLDHHLQCGDALLGLTDLKALEFGIPKAAFKPLSGDEKAVCAALAKANTAALKQLEKDRNSPQFQLPLGQAGQLAELRAIEAMPQQSTKQIAKQEEAYRAFLDKAQHSPLRHAADLVLGAFLLAKTESSESTIPTTASLYLELVSSNHNAQHLVQREAAAGACAEARVLHWPLAFPQVFAEGGFDCVLGNPPWEHIELKEEEFFATRNADVARAKNKAERTQRIQWLGEGMLARNLLPELQHKEQECTAEVRLFAEYSNAKRTLDATSTFAHVNGDEGGRYPLTGVGRVNTYALFAETFLQVLAENGRGGLIVPSGIATDDTTKRYFQYLVRNRKLNSLFGFDNARRIFPAVHPDTPFSLVTIGLSEVSTELAHYLLSVDDLTDVRRRFALLQEEFRLINPNTLTCPVFRSERDAELTKKLYRSAPVLINEGEERGNPWGISFVQGTHNMSSDSHLFHGAAAEGLLPLYEAKMIHQFDHRWATYQSAAGAQAAGDGESDSSRDCSPQEKANPQFSVTPRYWVAASDVNKKLADKGWDKGWLMGWRDITNATNERTVIASVVPRSGVGNQMPLLFADVADARFHAALLANFAALTLDFVARHKTGGTHMNYFIFKQLPVLPPERYADANLDFIVPRVLELTYSAHDLASWASDLGYNGEPFAFDPTRRAQLRAELDAYYARLYGLNRDELRYILDPADVMGDDYPSETFRVLKKNELNALGEYRTQRLVLEAWDKLESGELR